MGKHYFDCHKLKNGKVICYDYRLRECYRKGDDLVLKYKNKEMTIPHDQLKEKAMKIDKTVYQSKFGKPYGVYHFNWKQDENEDQQKLF